MIAAALINPPVSFTCNVYSDGTGGPSAATLVGWAQRLVAHDMGLKDAALLDESFFFLGPFDG